MLGDIGRHEPTRVHDPTNYRPLMLARLSRESTLTADICRVVSRWQNLFVLQLSSIRGFVTPWTYFLHLSLSSVILIWLTLPRRVLSTSWCCPSRPCVAFLACVHLTLFLALSLFPGNSLVSSWCNHSMLDSLLWRCLTVPSLLQLC